MDLNQIQSKDIKIQFNLKDKNMNPSEQLKQETISVLKQKLIAKDKQINQILNDRYQN